MHVVFHYCFGSAHPFGFNAVMVDGSVRRIRYDVDFATFRHLCSRVDGQRVDWSMLE
jgi:prepilin-type processing-associated H-X9-DG protein